MKAFSLEEYLKNPDREVVTRNGRKVRIICTDCKVARPIIAIVNEGCSDMLIVSYWRNGRQISNSDTDDLDLFFAPSKHEGWMNVYRDKSGTKYGNLIYDSEEIAKSEKNNEGYLATIKVEWEE